MLEKQDFKVSILLFDHELRIMMFQPPYITWPVTYFPDHYLSQDGCGAPVNSPSKILMGADAPVAPALTAALL